MKQTYEVDKYRDKLWRLDGKLHREDGPAVELSNGDKHWYLNGKRHREDGPAVEFHNGATSWWLNGLRHREDGPAVEHSNGYKAWYYYGKYIFCKNNKEFLRMKKMLSFI